MNLYRSNFKISWSTNEKLSCMCSYFLISNWFDVFDFEICRFCKDKLSL